MFRGSSWVPELGATVVVTASTVVRRSGVLGVELLPLAVNLMVGGSAHRDQIVYIVRA